MSINLFDDIVAFTRLPVFSYDLIEPDGEPIGFGSLCELLAYMNDHNRDLKYGGQASKMEIWTDTGHSYSVVQKGSSFGLEFQLDDGSAQEILNRLFEEVAKFSFHANGRPKKPWEMKRNQWLAVHAIGSIAYNVIPCLSNAHQLQRCKKRDGTLVDPLYYMSSEFMARYGYGHNGPPYSASGETNARHEIQVEYALGRGELVPQEVLDEYLESPALGDEKALKEYLQKPFLVGRVSASELQMLLSLLRASYSDVTELTAENSGYLISLCKQVKDGSYFELDNLFYEKGIVKVRPQHAPNQGFKIGAPVNEFAETVRDEIIKLMVRNRKKSTEDQYEKKFLTNRERDFQIASCDHIAEGVSFDGPNRVANWVSNRNLVNLLEYLDQTGNEATKKAIFSHFGIKLIGVTAAERRRGVFKLCGYASDFEIQAAEIALQKAKLEAKQKQDAEEEAERKSKLLETSKAHAVRTIFLVDNERLNGAEFIDKKVSEGYNELGTVRRGAVNQITLKNKVTGRFYILKRADGTAAYAEALLRHLAENIT